MFLKSHDVTACLLLLRPEHFTVAARTSIYKMAPMFNRSTAYPDSSHLGEEDPGLTHLLSRGSQGVLDSAKELVFAVSVSF